MPGGQPKAETRIVKPLVRIQHPETGDWHVVPQYKLLTTDQMSEITGMSIRWFELRRSAGDGPRFYRCSPNGQVRYAWPDWCLWLDKQADSDYAKVFGDDD